MLRRTRSGERARSAGGSSRPAATRRIGGILRLWAAAAILAAVALGGSGVAHAQGRVAEARSGDARVDELAQTLTSSSEKARMSAAVALGNLGDRRAMKPLVTALADSSAQIRTVAAAALGKLAHKATLPALKGAANDDPDATVRAAAREAAITVAKANQLPTPWPEPAPSAAPRGRPGFGKQPRALEPAPDLYVLVNTSTDDSPGSLDKAARKEHADIIRAALVERCKSAPAVTTAASDARRFGLDTRNIDMSVVKMAVVTTGPFVEVEAELRLAISDSHGKMLSFLSGGAKIQVPRARFNAQYLPRMRREALESAVQGLFDKLVAHLRDRRANS